MNKSDISEKGLTDAERLLFHQAKVKELKSFFECGVWEFNTTDQADATRTLSSRMLLKWSKNPDGSPRAKARLVVRGYKDALQGNLDTASPTATRLARSLLMSFSATKKWRGWSADVATAFLQGLPQERLLWLRLPRECLEILGATADTRMLLKKPVYGQLDAPRRWYLEASRRLKSLGWTQHILDPCLLLLHHADAHGDPLLCGLIALHVDDMLGCGDQDDPFYIEAERALKTRFDFRTWETDEKPMEYCGVHHIRDGFTWRLSQEQYLKKCKPMTIHRGRQPEDEMTDHDRTQLRALLGSLQWPAVQSAPQLQCSASLISGMQKTNKVRAVIEANQLLKFAKENADVNLTFKPLEIQSLADLRLVIMFDAAHGVREDATSQGGYIALLTTEQIFHEETDYHVVDWRSFKLPRVARSSLSAEAQACGQASDMAEFICRFWHCMLRPPSKLKDVIDLQSELKPTLITDAKALYDSYYKEGGNSSSVDKRAGLEIRVAKEQMLSLGGTLRWVSSERQYADGLTKSSTRKLLAERLRYGRLKLVWDPSYTSAKRKDASAREMSRNEFAVTKKKKKKAAERSDLNPTRNSHYTTSTSTTLDPIVEDEALPETDAPSREPAMVAGSVSKSMLCCLVYFSQLKGATAAGAYSLVDFDALLYWYPWNVSGMWSLYLACLLVAFLGCVLGWCLGARTRDQLTRRLAATTLSLETTRTELTEQMQTLKTEHEAQVSDMEERFGYVLLEHHRVVKENEDLRVWMGAATRDLENDMRREDLLSGQVWHAGCLLTRVLDELDATPCEVPTLLHTRIRAYVDQQGREDYEAFFRDHDSDPEDSSISS